ncbi:hypothetical protein [Chryseolinea soli]|uniref:Uncharacterized protein n=1 Tax=Chryseolinea soli TaxID=2321403 RepID=A0A385SUD2_9BACT|nr:hypothetical protein [Chryseolinea soli]AYB33737.1 hypothetical protein D4L85_25540 [Chryseolinea soli]
MKKRSKESVVISKAGPKQPVIIRNWYHRPYLAVICQVLGGLIIFSSWIVERTFQQAWSEEVEKLKGAQVMANILEINRSSFEIAVVRDRMDSMELAFYKGRLTKIYMDLLTIGHGKATDHVASYDSLLRFKEKLFEPTQPYMTREEYTKVSTNFDLVSRLFNSSYKRLDNSLAGLLEAVHQLEDFWSSIFTTLYVVGSLFIGAGYVFEKILSLQTN